MLFFLFFSIFAEEMGGLHHATPIVITNDDNDPDQAEDKEYTYTYESKDVYDEDTNETYQYESKDTYDDDESQYSFGRSRDHDYFDSGSLHHGSKKKKKEVICNYPNTRPGYGDNCVCNDSYVGDNPIQPRGCWICNDTCHSQAVCSYPGVCECSNGLVGDGVKSCKQPKPNIVSAKSYSSENLSYPTVVVEIENFTNFMPFFGYCKISNEIILARVIDSTHLECLVTDPNAKSVSVSLDRVNWTNEVDFESVKRGRTIEIDTKPREFPKATIEQAVKINQVEDGFFFAQALSFICLIGLIATIFLPSRLFGNRKSKFQE